MFVGYRSCRAPLEKKYLVFVDVGEGLILTTEAEDFTLKEAVFRLLLVRFDDLFNNRPMGVYGIFHEGMKCVETVPEREVSKPELLDVIRSRGIGNEQTAIAIVENEELWAEIV